MAYRFEVEVKLSSARDLKNVNWRNGVLRPYAVLWVDPSNKCSTRVDEEGDTCPVWDETLVIPLPGPIDHDSTLYVDVVHAGSEHYTKPLIGSARLRLCEVIDDVGFGERAERTLKLKRPSGRPQGKVDVKVSVREPYHRDRAPEPYQAPRYGVPQASREYHAPPAYGNPYAAPPTDPYHSVAPYSAYGQPSYGVEQVYEQKEKEKKKDKFGGMGTGLAVGAAAGLIGGLALSEGFDYMEDKIADDVAERVEDDLERHDDDDDDDGDDDE